MNNRIRINSENRESCFFYERHQQLLRFQIQRAIHNTNLLRLRSIVATRDTAKPQLQEHVFEIFGIDIYLLFCFVCLVVRIVLYVAAFDGGNSGSGSSGNDNKQQLYNQILTKSATKSQQIYMPDKNRKKKIQNEKRNQTR